MTAPFAARPLAALAALAIVVAACGTGTTTQAPATQGPATQAPATQAPATTARVTQAPAATGAASSDPLASFHGAQDLEGLLPDDIGGSPVIKASLSGTDFMTMGGGEELQKALTSLGKTPSDLKVAFGSAGTVTIFAFQVSGVPGGQILSALFAAQSTTSTVTDASFGGKTVKKVVSSDDAGTSYIYTAQDVVFVVAGTDLTDAQLNEVFTKLP